MEELLVQFEQGEPGAWPWKILGAIDPDYIGFGFSEYASYVSWMLQNPSEPGGKCPISSKVVFRSSRG